MRDKVVICLVKWPLPVRAPEGHVAAATAITEIYGAAPVMPEPVSHPSLPRPRLDRLRRSACRSSPLRQSH